MRVLGPNCIGLLDTHLPLDTTFLPLPGPIPGDIAFVSHSGAICEAVIDWARGQGFGLSRLVSLGNQMDVSEADAIGPTAADPHTRVVALYLEGVADGAAFIREASKVTASKPVVAVKVGRSPRGRAAVASHTGALAGEDAAFAAAFRKAGVLRADTSEALFDWARALAWCPLPAGRRVAVLTNAGGPGAIAVDALDAQGLELSNLSPESTQALAAMLPSAASLANPVDMLASAGPYEYSHALQVLLADAGVDAVMLILPPPPVSTAADVVGALIPVIQAARKPVVVALMGEDLILQAAGLLRQSRIPDYRFPERAASALRVLVARAERLARAPEPAYPTSDVDLAEARQIVRDAGADDGFLPAGSVLKLAACYGLTVPSWQTAHDPDEAARAADAIGYPIALKLASAEHTHKSDVGGVVLGLESGEQVRAAFEALAQRLAGPNSNVAPPEVLIQAMAPPGQEVDPRHGARSAVWAADHVRLGWPGSRGAAGHRLRAAAAHPPRNRSSVQHHLGRAPIGRLSQPPTRGPPGGD